MRKKKQHYINNERFLVEIQAFKTAVAEAAAAGKDKPPVPRYIGECFLKIADGLSNKPNFINYTYKDDMIGDGIENCLTYVENFDVNKSQNPFAYFTQIIWWAFVRRIEKEKKQMYIKHKAFEKAVVFDDEFSGATKVFDQDNERMKDLVETFERKNTTKQRTKKGVELFTEEEQHPEETEE